jgi:ankyrin repeat protein
MPRKKEEEPLPVVRNHKGIEIHYDENTTESMMRRVGIREMMELALKPDEGDRLLLQEELMRAKPNEDIIETLLEVEPERIQKRNPESGCLPIHIACLNIHSIDPGILLILLDAWPASIQKEDYHGFLPLHKALMANPINNKPPNLDNITMIVEAYPEGIKLQNKRGQYPIHCCVEAKRPFSQIVDLLIELGGKWICDVEDKFGKTPLHKAVTRSGPEALMIVEALVEKAPQCCKHQDERGMLPLHWAVSRKEPLLDMLMELIDAYPFAVIQKDNDGKMPVDRILAYGNDRCASSMNYLNTTYEKMLVIRKETVKFWEEDFLGNAPHVSKLKAPNQPPRPTPYTFGSHDWCLTGLNNTERQMALLIYRQRIQRKLIQEDRTPTDEDLRIYLLNLRHEFVKRGGKVECFGPPLSETNGGGPISGPHAKWWLAKIYLPDWDPNGKQKAKKYGGTQLKSVSKKAGKIAQALKVFTSEEIATPNLEPPAPEAKKE